VAEMPQLVKLQEELKDAGFALIAVHSQSVPKEQVLKLLKQNKVNYTVVAGGEVPGNPVSGIPAGFVFDSSGKLVGKGKPTGLKGTIQKLLESEPHYLAAGRKYSSKVAAVAESLKKSTAYGQALKRLEKDASGSGPAAEEAKYLAERLNAHGEYLIERAKALEAEDAYKALQSYGDIAGRYKGSKLGEKAEARQKELKADKDFQEELKAATVLNSILTECNGLVWQGKGEINLENAMNKKVSPRVTAGVQMLKKKFPKSKAAARVNDELSIYGFKNV
jgi:hypothetical protein